MGNIEKKLTMFFWLLFISYPFCGHARILKVSLSSLPLCHLAQFFEELKRISLTATFQADLKKNYCILGDMKQF